VNGFACSLVHDKSNLQDLYWPTSIAETIGRAVYAGSGQEAEGITRALIIYSMEHEQWTLAIAQCYVQMDNTAR
jgi:hypothetical protein